MLVQIISQSFEETFGHEPELIVKSPGRINIIGEHIDYNGGLVMPAAVDRYIYVGIRRRRDRRVKLYSLDFKQLHTVEIDQLRRYEPGRWENYVLGVVDQFLRRGVDLNGFEMVIAGNIPFGIGLSSSAALENAVSYALNQVFSVGLSKMELVRISQRAEHHFAGVQCGVMDQFASMFGKAENFIVLDTVSLSYEYEPLALGEFQFVLLNTNVKHTLAASEYNKRRQLCELAAKKLGVDYLLQSDLSQLGQFRSYFSPEDYAAIEYVFEENERVRQMCNAIRDLDFERIGQLLYDSHEGLSKKYKVSCPELDFLVEKARESEYVFGARMMGGGFGGCTINLIQRNRVKDFYEQVYISYVERFDRFPELIEVEIVDGTSIVRG